VLGTGLTNQPCKKVIVTKPHWGGQGPNWAAEPYDDDDEYPGKQALIVKNI
jgi:hypothetical protein